MLQTRSNPSLRRKSRDGLGVRLYLTPDEAKSLLGLAISQSVRAKLEARIDD